MEGAADWGEDHTCPQKERERSRPELVSHVHHPIFSSATSITPSFPQIDSSIPKPISQERLHVGVCILGACFMSIHLDE